MLRIWTGQYHGLNKCMVGPSPMADRVGVPARCTNSGSITPT